MGRKLARLVIHCTATPEGREVTSDEIRRWHTSPVSEGGRGWHQVGYTDMIHLDGSIEQLVCNNDDDVVDSWEVTNGAKGYNSTSRHIVYVGGLALDARTPKDTRTSLQLSAMTNFVRSFHDKFPDVEIMGHNQLSNKACPSFDVPTWLQTIGIYQ